MQRIAKHASTGHVITIVGMALSFFNLVHAAPPTERQAFEMGRQQLNAGKYYAAAATFFNVYTAQGELQNTALASVTESLIRAGVPNTASYFYIKTLQSNDRAAIRKVLPYLPNMIEQVGGDLLRKYVLKHTSESDYDAASKNHFYYFLGKDELLKGNPDRALHALSRIGGNSNIAGQTAYLKGTAFAMQGKLNEAIASFKSCSQGKSKIQKRARVLKHESEDLEARCTASLARSYYQAGQHDKAEETYDEIPKASFVWTDILFEQAWNAYAKNDFNRALGKLVTYRSPALEFVFNPEVDVLRAQSFLALCVYDDVNRSVNEFNSRYADVGSQMKNFLLGHENDIGAYFVLAKQVYGKKIHRQDMMNKALNRFIRGPYFAALIEQERATQAELASISHSGVRGSPKFSEFLTKVLNWRLKTITLLGGAFVKNSMYDLYQDLLADLDKMSYIKLEMLKRTKQSLEKKQILSEDENGEMKKGSENVGRRDYQYYWTFNGEFWADELGDYVFALESQCGS